MIVALHHDERVARGILGRHVPGLLAVPGTSADAQPRALPQGVERQPLVNAEPLACRRLDRTWRSRQETCQELAKRPLADEADAGTVGFVEHREAGAPRERAHRDLLELAERHERACELRALYGM